MRITWVSPVTDPERGTLWWVRAVLGFLGVAALCYALFGFIVHVPLAQWIWVLAWLAAALLVHDGVLVPLTTLVGGGLRRITFGLPPAQQGIVRGALLVGALVTLVVAPTIRAQQVLQPNGRDSGENNTVLQGDYALALGIFWLALVLLAALAVAAVGFYGRRPSVRNTLP